MIMSSRQLDVHMHKHLSDPVGEQSALFPRKGFAARICLDASRKCWLGERILLLRERITP